MSLFVAEPIFETHEPVYFAVQSTLTRAHEQARQMQAFSGLSAPDRDSDRHCQPHLFAIADRHTRRRIDARLALFAKRRSRPLLAAIQRPTGNVSGLSRQVILVTRYP